MFWIKGRDKAVKEKMCSVAEVQILSPPSSPPPPSPFSNTPLFLQAAISTKLVPRVLIAVYEAHLLARECVFV